MRKQRIVPGRLAPAYEAELGRLRAQQVIARLWNREPGLWKDDAAHAGTIANRLGWLSVVDQMRSEAADLTDFANNVSVSGLRNIVLLGMGGSSLAPEVFSLLFPPGPGGRRFFVLDTTDPESLRAVQSLLEPENTLFIVASKSGSTIETLSQFQYFLDRLQRAGVAQPGKHFIAITDAGSRLDKLAQEHSFRRVFRNPADIGGRYSALSFFGLVPAALWGIDVNAILDTASEMMAASGPQAAPENNPALRLAALLGAGAMQGCDKLFLLSPRKVEPLANWIEQLVAESTGKEGRGIVPIVAGPDTPIELLEQGAITVALTLDGHDDAAVTRTMAALEERGAPMAEIRMAGPADLGAEFFRWELATVIAGVALSIDPFDEPNVQESKDATARLLREFENTDSMPQGALVLAESGIELYAEAAEPSPAQALQVSDALRVFLSAAAGGELPGAAGLRGARRGKCGGTGSAAPAPGAASADSGAARLWAAIFALDRPAVQGRAGIGTVCYHHFAQGRRSADSGRALHVWATADGSGAWRHAAPGTAKPARRAAAPGAGRAAGAGSTSRAF